MEGFSTKSNFARKHAAQVAAAASCGYLTTRIDQNHFGTWWRVTGLGMQFMAEMESLA